MVLHIPVTEWAVDSGEDKVVHPSREPDHKATSLQLFGGRDKDLPGNLEHPSRNHDKDSLWLVSTAWALGHPGLDDIVVLSLPLHKVLLRELDFPSAEQFLVFLKMGLNISELVEQLVVLEYFEVFNVIIGLIIALELLSGLSRVDSLED